MYLQHGNAGVGTTYLMFLAYKSIAQKPPQFFLDMFEIENNIEKENDSNGHTVSSTNDTKNDRNSKIKSLIGQNKFDRYDIFFNLVTHVDTLSTKDLLERVITSIFLLNCLEATKYFADVKCVHNGSCSLKAENLSLNTRVKFAGLLFHSYCAILSNSFAVSEINASNVDEDKKPNNINRIQRSLTGNAVFPTPASLINHSCDPNTTCIFINGKTQVI